MIRVSYQILVFGSILNRNFGRNRKIEWSQNRNAYRNRKLPKPKVSETESFRNRKFPKPKSIPKPKVSETESFRNRKFPKPKVSKTESFRNRKAYRNRKLPKPKSIPKPKVSDHYLESFLVFVFVLVFVCFPKDMKHFILFIERKRVTVKL